MVQDGVPRPADGGTDEFTSSNPLLKIDTSDCARGFAVCFGKLSPCAVGWVDSVGRSFTPCSRVPCSSVLLWPVLALEVSAASVAICSLPVCAGLCFAWAIPIFLRHAIAMGCSSLILSISCCVKFRSWAILVFKSASSVVTALRCSCVLVNSSWVNDIIGVKPGCPWAGLLPWLDCITGLDDAAEPPVFGGFWWIMSCL